MFYIIGLSRLNIYRWICHALIEDSLKTLKFTKDNDKKFLVFFSPLYLFAGNSHRYNKLSLWRGPKIVTLSRVGLVARPYVCAHVYLKGILFHLQIKRSDFFLKTIKEKDKKFQKHLVFIFLYLKKRKCVCVYVHRYTCVYTYTHTHPPPSTQAHTMAVQIHRPSGESWHL